MKKWGEEREREEKKPQKVCKVKEVERVMGAGRAGRRGKAFLETKFALLFFFFFLKKFFDLKSSITFSCKAEIERAMKEPKRK